MSHDCGTGCGRPTSANICTTCARQLEDALAKLGTWAHHPTRPLVVEWCHLPTRELRFTPIGGQLPGGNLTGVPSSVFDSPSGRASIGKTQGLAAELDTQRSRQTRRGSMNGPRLAPDSKVWWPFVSKEWDLNRPAPKNEDPARRWRPGTTPLDRVETQLARAVALWVGRLAKADHGIPTVTVTGATLARACTLLLWHSKDIVEHADAAEAHRAFTDAAERIERLVDRPEDRVYAGPCWELLPDGSKCQADLLAKPGTKSVQCRACGVVHDVEYRRGWLADHMEGVELTATNCSRALATIGLSVTVSQITVWATREALISRGRVNVGKRSLTLYRVGDVMLLAYKAAEDPRGKAGTRQSA